jgi:hypothetical protein
VQAWYGVQKWTICRAGPGRRLTVTCRHSACVPAQAWPHLQSLPSLGPSSGISSESNVFTCHHRLSLLSKALRSAMFQKKHAGVSWCTNPPGGPFWGGGVGREVALATTLHMPYSGPSPAVLHPRLVGPESPFLTESEFTTGWPAVSTSGLNCSPFKQPAFLRGIWTTTLRGGTMVLRRDVLSNATGRLSLGAWCSWY